MLKHTFDLELTVMTAVHVWSGYRYTVGADTYIRDNRMYIIDPDKFASLCMGRRRVLDEIVFGTSTLATIIQKYSLPVENLSRLVLEISNGLSSKIISIKEVMSNNYVNDKPAIPGSEIKGLIRTAILFDLTEKRIMDKKFYEQLKGQIEYVLENCRQNVLIAGLPIEILLKGWIAGFKSGRKRENPYDIMHFLQVSDPYTDEYGSVIDSIVTVYRDDPRNVIAETFIETIPSNTMYKYRIAITKPVMKDMVSKSISLGILDRSSFEQMLSKYIEILDPNNILNSLKKFSEELLEYEIGILKGFEGKGFDLSIVDEMKEWLTEVREGNNVFYLKIGYGAGHYSKTVYLAIPDDLRRLLKQVMTQCKDRLWDDVSYRVLGSYYHQDKLIPFAWVKLKIKRVR